MTALRLHNTLTRSFVEVADGQAGGTLTFYSCGPTVYDDAHIGNFRSFLNADLLRRALELLGHRVRHVMNITDVGHMTEDDVADGGGEDKMAVAARRITEARKSGAVPSGFDVDPADPVAIADFYAARFVEDACRLGLKVALEADALRAAGADPGIVMPRASRCIPQMIAMIGELIAAGHAYRGFDGAIYFSVPSFPAYGRLSGNTLDQLREGAGERINANDQASKRHPADFLLWKPDSRHLMRWPSPWGEGYPGWHIECSAMARMLLGPQIDLHSGGEDNIFPHHECEIAQSCCASGRPQFARVWFHTRHLQVEGQKMSKSRGNFLTARDVFARGVSPGALRLELIRTHYRSNANFTMQGLHDCQRMIERWGRILQGLVRRAATASAPDPMAASGPVERSLLAFTSALCDDLNVARAIAAVNGGCREATAGDAACPHRELTSMLAIDSVLGVLGRGRPLAPDSAPEDAVLGARVDQLLVLRAAARSAKDWAESDRIRSELARLGVVVKDGPGGPTWSRA